MYSIISVQANEARRCFFLFDPRHLEQAMIVQETRASFKEGFGYGGRDLLLLLSNPKTE